MTTYAELLDGVGQQIRAGTEPLRTDRLWTPDQALESMGDFHAVLDAIASHTRRLLWPAQIRRIGAASHRAGLPPIERTAVALVAGIENLVGAARPHPCQLSPATKAWRNAALRLRAASDLIATHFDPDGRPRTPDAAATDARALHTGLADLGHLTGVLLAAEEPLALRALQTGVPRTLVVKHLPGLGRVATLARDLATSDNLDAGGRARLAALPQTSTPIRTGDPVTELADRMQRLRQATFDMRTGPDGTLATLRDVTTIGIAVHAHTAAFHGAQLTAEAAPPTRAHGPEALILRGRAWQQLHRELSRFIALSTPDTTVRDDLVALTRLLPDLAPLDARASGATSPEVREIGAGLNGAVATMTDIGAHGAAAFEDLAGAGTLRLHARDLPRGLVAEDPDLARAQLSGAFLAPPTALTDAVIGAFRLVRVHPIDGLFEMRRSGGFSRLERQMEAMVLTRAPEGP